ncbi:DUF881 domain-containing protein [Halalkalibacter urbisdiaboli]|uniref:DUF881 domain-containing protein n=1 Tax=Halalkalibacter urbisdiaboli TaxID=1960589 RepID=UPI000B42D93E|nr:DUF881 domain-containing protein [Halalkalibacter urbisdiaboli]
MDRKWIFTIITLVIGFMLAIQFQTTQEPVVRDTRDIRELRNELRFEQERRQQLNEEIEKTRSLLFQYETSLENRDDNIIEVLQEQIELLREEAGLTEKKGKGIVITIDSLNQDFYLNETRRTPPPALFRYLVNELNIYGAKEIAVGDERIISISAFRDVNGITHLNTRRLPPLPVEVKVISDQPERLHNHMVVSESLEYFEIDGYSFEVTVVDEIVLPAFEQTPRVRYMEEVKEG